MRAEVEQPADRCGEAVGLFRGQGLHKLPSTWVTGGHALEREFCHE
jgi:hypothetical protein